jgi:carboxyl-terminal processing protease
MGKVKGHKGLVIDLRGNPGGYETSLLRLLSYFLEKDTKVADLIRRKETKPLIAKSQRGHAFPGKVVVLVDSDSASAAELFARMMQIEKRGVVLGDNSLGRVMRSQYYSYTYGVDRVVFYGASITDADMTMTDGKSLEGTGVTPDEILRPTAADIAAGRDPVLARAAELLGVKLDSEAAGKFFPIEWLKDS